MAEHFSKIRRQGALSVSRKGDRLKMVQQVKELVESVGLIAVVDLEYLPAVYKRCSSIVIKDPITESYVGIRFDADSSQPNTFVCTWNTPPKGNKIDKTVSFSKQFAESNGMPHPNPYGVISKVTRVWEGFHTLMHYLPWDLEAIDSRTAFDWKLAAKYDEHVRNGEMPWQQVRKPQAQTAA